MKFISCLKSVNPMDGKEFARYPVNSTNEINCILDRSRSGFSHWAGYDIQKRSDLFQQLARQLREKAQHFGELMAREMGKPLKEGIAEAQKSAWVCEYYAENAAEFLADRAVKGLDGDAIVTFQPLGTVLAIMPWNFPFWQVFRFAAPTLMAGNTGILKHASNVTGCSLEIEKLFKEAGFPEGVFQSVLIPGNRVSELIDDPRINAVTLTGSTPAGKAVATAAGKNLKKSVLELGGSDPYIVLQDADIRLAVEKCVTSRMINNGQSCIAAKRFIVHQAVYEDFVNQMQEKMSKITMGDPLEMVTQLGPLARHDLRNELHKQVETSVEAGAKLILGGECPDHPAAFYPPTILTDVTSNTPAYHQELFGPVASVIRVENDEEAVKVANDSKFGLGAAVFTGDLEKGKKLAKTFIQTGSCFVNDFVKSDPRLPFGGIKESGYGRELSNFGIHEFVNVKTLLIK